MGITVGEKVSSAATIALKSDEIRLFSKNGMKLISNGSDIYINGKNVYIADNKNNTEPLVLGDTLKGLLSDLIDALNDTQVILSPAGPGPLTPSTQIKLKTIQSKLSNILSNTIKLKKN